MTTCDRGGGVGGKEVGKVNQYNVIHVFVTQLGHKLFHYHWSHE